MPRIIPDESRAGALWLLLGAVPEFDALGRRDKYHRWTGLAKELDSRLLITGQVPARRHRPRMDGRRSVIDEESPDEQCTDANQEEDDDGRVIISVRGIVFVLAGVGVHRGIVECPRMVDNSANPQRLKIVRRRSMQRQPTDNFEQPTLSYQPTRDRAVRTPRIALAFAVLSVSSFAILAFRGSTDSAATLFLLSW